MNRAALLSLGLNRGRSRMHRSVVGFGAALTLALSLATGPAAAHASASADANTEAPASLPALATPSAEQAIPRKPSHRVITLAPHATELVFAAGGGDSIVGTVTSSDFPEEALAIPRIGDGIVLNQERIILLKPTLFVGWLRSGIALQIEALAGRMGADMHYARPLKLRDIPADVRGVGQLLNTDATATAAAAAMDARIDAMEQRYADKRPVSVFIEVGHMPLYTIGEDPLLNDGLRICGAVNVYGTTGMPAPRVPIESVLVHDPDLLVTADKRDPDGTQAQARWKGYGLRAAAQGHLHAADPDALFRPGPRFIDAIEQLCPVVDAVRQRQTSAG